jgi:hypothetical protein
LSVTRRNVWANTPTDRLTEEIVGTIPATGVKNYVTSLKGGKERCEEQRNKE